MVCFKSDDPGVADLQNWERLAEYAATEILGSPGQRIYLRAVQGEPPHESVLRGRIADQNSLLTFCAAVPRLAMEYIELEVRPRLPTHLSIVLNESCIVPRRCTHVLQ